MLAALENQLVLAVKSAFDGTSVQVLAGPVGQADAKNLPSEFVQVHARALRIVAPEGTEQLTVSRQPAYVVHRPEWETDGHAVKFPLPSDVEGEVVAVEAPAGTLYRRGDEYVLRGKRPRRIEFYRAPPAGKVVATVQGAPAEGYREELPCRIAVDLRAWGQTMQDADTNLAKALDRVCDFSIDFPVIDGDFPEDLSLRARLPGASLRFEGIERSESVLEKKAFRCALARLTVEGKLEWTVARGAAADFGRIRRLKHRLEILSPDPNEQDG